MIYISGNISDEEYAAETKRVRSEIDKAKQHNEEDRPADLTSIKQFLGSNFLTTYDTLGKEDKRRFWRSMIEEIYVDGTKITGVKPRI